MWSAVSKGFKMAKRYHQSMRDRMHERRGEMHHMERMHKDRMHEKAGMEKYESHMDPRRRHEMNEQGMLYNDPREIANMPQDVMMKGYERIHGFLPESIDDSRHEIEREIRQTDRMSREQYSPKKW